VSTVPLSVGCVTEMRQGSRSAQLACATREWPSFHPSRLLGLSSAGLRGTRGTAFVGDDVGFVVSQDVSPRPCRRGQGKRVGRCAGSHGDGHLALDYVIEACLNCPIQRRVAIGGRKTAGIFGEAGSNIRVRASKVVGSEVDLRMLEGQPRCRPRAIVLSALCQCQVSTQAKQLYSGCASIAERPASSSQYMDVVWMDKLSPSAGPSQQKTTGAPYT
jgi:hypothetical protein